MSSENLISFQGNTPTGGITYATVRGFSASIMGRPGGGLPTAASTVLGTYYNSALPGSATYYTSFSQQMAWGNTTENKAYTVVPFTYGAQVLCVNTTSNQIGGSLTVNLRKNGSNAGPQVIIPTGGAAGTWCDGGHSFTSATTGDQLDLQLVNTYGSTSAYIVSITLSMTPTSSATGMLVFGLGAQTLLTAANNYFAPFGGSVASSTSANAQVALPRAVALKNLHCYVNTCPPAGTTANIEVFQNGSFPDGRISLYRYSVLVAQPATSLDTIHTGQFIAGRHGRIMGAAAQRRLVHWYFILLGRARLTNGLLKLDLGESVRTAILSTRSRDLMFPRR